MNGVAVTNGQVVGLRGKSAKSPKGGKSSKSGKDGAVLIIDGPTLELGVTCVDGSGNGASATATAAFPQKSVKSVKSKSVNSAKSGKGRVKSQKWRRGPTARPRSTGRRHG